MNKKQYADLLSKFNQGDYLEVVRVIGVLEDKNFDLLKLESASWSLLGNYPSAKTAYLEALKIKPNDFEVRYNFAKLEKLHGSIIAAEEMLQDLSRDFSFNEQVLIELGVLASERGDYKLAEEYFRKALALQPNNVIAAKNLSTLLTHSGKFNAAIDLLSNRQFIGNVSITLQLATIAQLASHYAEAERLFLSLLDENKFAQLNNEEKVSFYTNYGGLLVEIGRPAEAEALYQKAINLNEHSVMAHLNWALYYYKVLNDYGKADVHFRKAVGLEPDGIEVNKWYGNYLRDMGDVGRALDLLRSAASHRPDEPELLYNLALAELSNGELELGWLHHEMRWIRPEGGVKPDYQAPDWEGQDGEGKSILVYREQGLGDEFFFATCLPDLAKKFSAVVYACHPKIVTLIARSYPEIIVIPNRVPRHELALEQFDYKAAIGSIPRWLRSSVSKFPLEPRPVLCDPIRAAHWVERLAAYGNTLKVGIAWRSGYVTDFRSKYFLQLQEMAPLFELNNITIVNLQYQITTEEREFLDAKLGVGWVYPREVDLYDDLDASASLFKACDLIVSVGTSTAAIAGAMGIPTLMFNPMLHEWMQLGTDGYPWLPAITILAKSLDQPWTTPVQQAAYIIAALAAEKKAIKS
ncbi:lipopolysaccharide assembly protein LapB [Chitinibacter sp. GC72]|uniref:tetratricopeptide repeat protein n=1 Tax=Chitinibacter sp. GC72 TaxID=1526917 RepID=UPI0012FA68A0|nr:tetratricopeptide repeat protein [Chitinibacter sp. GC72]